MSRRETTIQAKIDEAYELLDKTAWWHFIKRWALQIIIFSLKYALNECEIYLEAMVYEEKN